MLLLLLLLLVSLVPSEYGLTGIAAVELRDRKGVHLFELQLFFQQQLLLLLLLLQLQLQRLMQASLVRNKSSEGAGFRFKPLLPLLLLREGLPAVGEGLPAANESKAGAPISRGKRRRTTQF